MLPDFGLRQNLGAGLGSFIVHGGQLGLVFIGFELGSPLGWLTVSAGIGALSVVAWFLALRRWRSMADTPTSQVATAAQGYVELSGRGQPLAGLPLLSPLNGLPCLWYRYVVETRDSHGRWRRSDAATSDASLILKDGSGECLIDPDGAEVISDRKDSWTDGDQRYTQWLLLKGEPLYALGQFTTRNGLDLQLDRNEDVKHLLAEWKRDHPQLLKRFDLDRDGQVNLREWELARRAARREVEANHRELRGSADLHLMHRPADGRLYLLSNVPAERLARRYRIWAWVHLVVFFAALYAVVYFHNHGGGV